MVSVEEWRNSDAHWVQEHLKFLSTAQVTHQINDDAFRIRYLHFRFILDVTTALGPDEIYQHVVNSQRSRLDDQRVMLTSLPGIEAFTIKEQKETNALKTSFDQICNMVSSAQVSFLFFESSSLRCEDLREPATYTLDLEFQETEPSKNGLEPWVTQLYEKAKLQSQQFHPAL